MITAQHNAHASGFRGFDAEIVVSWGKWGPLLFYDGVAQNQDMESTPKRKQL